MKIKFYPKKDTILGLLQLRIDSAAEELAKDEADYQRKSKFLPDYSRENVVWSREQLNKLTDLRSLVESHAYPHITCEADI